MPVRGEPRKAQPRATVKPVEVAVREILSVAQGKLPGDVVFYGRELTLDRCRGDLLAYVRHELGEEALNRELDACRAAEDEGTLPKGATEAAWPGLKDERVDNVFVPEQGHQIVLFLTPILYDVERFRQRHEAWPDLLVCTPKLAEAIARFERRKWFTRGVVLGLPWTIQTVMPADRVAWDYFVAFARDRAPTASDVVRPERDVELTRAVPTRKGRKRGRSRLGG